MANFSNYHKNPHKHYGTMVKPRLTESQEDYLKHIFKLKETSETVSTQDLAVSLGVRPASVTGMIKKLSSMELVDHKPYKGVLLTDVGEKIALEVLRHHRLLELYLVDYLNYSWDEIHDEAERLEHVISEKFEATISELMGHPTRDPHGDPIPTVDLEIPVMPDLISIDRLHKGQDAVIHRVFTQDRDILNMLTRLELTIDTNVSMAGRDNAGVRIKVGGNQYLIPYTIAKLIWVQ